MRILLTNDDGIYAQGLMAIKAELEKIADVLVIAPLTEQSAVGHAITISDPLKVIPISRAGEFYGYGITGTPADCVKLGVSSIMDPPPDIVISGINKGENVGINVLYSGTVSAATEALILGYTGIAVSVDDYFHPNYAAASTISARIAERLTSRGGHLPFALNINCPSLELDQIQGIRITRQGTSRFVDKFVKRTDPRGIDYYWQAGTTKVLDTTQDTDAVCLKNKMVSITPIHFKLGCAYCDFLADFNLEGILNELSA